MRNRLTLALASCALLAGCGGSSRPVLIPPAQPPVTRPTPTATRPPEPQVMRVAGLEGVIGANATRLLRDFGEPRIDLAEGDARKLQFAGPPCVLDIYLYPPSGGGEPVATHVDARRASDGQDVDRASCVDALRRR